MRYKFVIYLMLDLVVLSYSQSTDWEKSVHAIVDTFTGEAILTHEWKLTNDTFSPPIEEDVKFHCTLPNSNKFKQTFINDPDIHSKVDVSGKLGILMHSWVGSFEGGYVNNYVKGWMKTTSQSWANNASRTVCAVDYSRLGNYEYYIVASKHAKLVASFLTHFLRYLNGLGISFEDMTLVGHSLGAQIIGLTGAELDGQIGEIFGLDPAAPGFTIPVIVNEAERLDASDAKRVEIIHTSAGIFGVQINCGHADYWVNGGTSQPGCEKELLSKVGSSEPFICSLMRAIEYFELALSKLNHFTGSHCPDDRSTQSSHLSRDKCSGEIDQFGIWTQWKNGTFFVKTTSTAPFCNGE